MMISTRNTGEAMELGMAAARALCASAAVKATLWASHANTDLLHLLQHVLPRPKLSREFYHQDGAGYQ